MFDRESIPTYSWEDIRGMTLKIDVAREDDCSCLFGYDKSNDKIYLLAIDLGKKGKDVNNERKNY